MKTMHLFPLLLLPFLAVGQVQFVAFQPYESNLQITQAYETISLTFEVQQPYYIHVDDAQLDDDALIPTKLSLEPIQGVKICSITFSEPATKMPFGKNKTIGVLDGSFTIHLQLETGQTTSSSSIPLKGFLFYQASDPLQCFPPKKLAFETNLEIIRP